ncbi:hypothetical protein ACTHPH_23565 [Paenibacillus pasadenensis]|uniref:Uncharacterized protein n=1 Tax=Paenibacillus pasadenensis TaxID=217090 RepID=A0A2N5NB07_9BACL|nr:MULTISPECIES: hypothetical protein [Paenibacillus]PLT47494.1 hypothetical protein B8V81_1718 [Paenibacillus pasadenensis]QGG57740.1 hypothetical protein GE073_20530 [Paenibacillus sp. B01]
MTDPKDKSLRSTTPSVADRDHPEQYPTEKESLMDQDPAQQHVDPIPVEDLTIEQQDEKDKTHTKDDSSSARKYRTGF